MKQADLLRADNVSPVPHHSSRVQRYVIIGDARTGSTLLTQALNSHPDVLCFGEVFNLVHPYVDYGVEGFNNNDKVAIEERARDPRAFLKKRVYGERRTGLRALGFKFPYGQDEWYPTVMQELLTDREIRVVHMQRRNSLRTLVSLKVAQTTGVWGTFDLPPWRQRFTRRKAMRALQDPRWAFSSVRGWLGRRTPPALDDRRIRLSPEECSAHFQRRDEVVARWAQMFSEHDDTRSLLSAIHKRSANEPGCAEIPWRGASPVVVPDAPAEPGTARRTHPQLR